ncbi:hypothetical protein KAH37_01180 [bacterium]|nr:hypothetical protein [bacterium]
MTYLPLSYMLGSRAKIDILRILVNKQNYTGRKIATLSSTNPNSNKKALDFLMGTGLVVREHIGNAFHYRINQKHLLYDSIITLFKEEEKTINRITKSAAAFIENYAPKTLAGFITHLKNDVMLTLLAHNFPTEDLKKHIFENTGFLVQVRFVDSFHLKEENTQEFVGRNYFWNNYKIIMKMVNNEHLVKNFFSF